MEIVKAILCLFIVSSCTAIRSKRQINTCDPPKNAGCVIVPHCPSIQRLYHGNGRLVQIEAYTRGLQRNCANGVNYPAVCCAEESYEITTSNNTEPGYRILQAPEQMGVVYSELYQIFEVCCAITFNETMDEEQSEEEEEKSEETGKTTSTSTSRPQSSTTIPITSTILTSTPSSSTVSPTISTTGSENACYDPDNRKGFCTSLLECPELLNRLKSNRSDRAFREFLRLSNEKCRAESPIICCPSEVVTAAAAPTPTSLENTDNCYGPDSKPGECLSLLDCPELLNRVKGDPSNKELRDFLRRSNEICRAESPIICCPTRRGNMTILSPRQALIPIQTKEARILTPEEGCGQSIIGHRRIVGGAPAKLGTWPWIALLGYTDDLGKNITFRCGGSLITKRHVISAAHCINSYLKIVRLGEHDKSIENETQHVDVNIQQTIRHKDYRHRSDGHSDIAIIYLQIDVEFTDTIRPICVPNGSEFEGRNIAGATPFVAGWGKIAEDGYSAEILQEVQLEIEPNRVCKQSYKMNKRLISKRQFDNATICAGASGKDSCSGDSGGPLMLPEALGNNTGKFYYNLIGVVSYGVGCARPGIPGVYTNSIYFAEWIREKVAELNN